MANWDDDGIDFARLGDPGRRKRNDARRALLGGVAGVAMLVGPIALANSIIPGDGGNGVSADDGSATSLVAQREASAGNAQYDSLQMKSLAERVTTTTTAPPTTTTTAPPTTTTTSPPMTAPNVPPLPGSGELGDPNLDASWDALAECESGGDWTIVSRNGLYYGGLQFSLSTWRGIGGEGYPNEHSREVQIAMGKKLWQTSGWGAWPSCTIKLGYR